MRNSLLLLLLIACRADPGDLGGTAQIAPVQLFVETDGFANAVALGRPLVVAAVREDALGNAAAEMTLDVSGGKYRIAAIAPGQAVIWLDEELDYKLTAYRYGAPAGFVPLVRAKALRRMRASPELTRLTWSDSCTQRETIAIEDATLAPNQELHFSLVGLDGSERPTLGTLELEWLALPPQIAVDAPLVGSAELGNTFIIRRGAAALGETITLSVRERETQVSVSLTIDTTEMLAPCVGATE